MGFRNLQEKLKNKLFEFFLPYWRLGIDARKVQQPLVQITLAIGQIPGPPTDFSREHHMETPETKIYFLN